MNKEDYQAYLRSDHWLQIRTRELRRARHRCEECGAASCLQIHHLSYRHLHNEQPGELKVLCVDCHQHSHTRTWQQIEEQTRGWGNS